MPVAISPMIDPIRTKHATMSSATPSRSMSRFIANYPSAALAAIRALQSLTMQTPTALRRSMARRLIPN